MPTKTSTPTTAASEVAERHITIEDFARSAAWRTNAMGDVVEAKELMGGFIHQMRQANRDVDTASNYRRDWAIYAGE
jgi:hypothetical protein